MEIAPEIIVLVGPPATGKSTWCADVSMNGTDGYVVLSFDSEIERLAEENGTTYYEGFKDYIGQATAIVKQKFRDAVNNNESIIWDQTNLTLKKRRGILNQVPDHYYKMAVAFEVTEQELNERLERRERETGKHIPREVVKDMASKYVPPTEQEGFDEVIIL